MQENIFQKIINKTIPAHIIYEDELTLAFLDISQTTPGHTLIIPKKNYQNIFQLDEEISKHLFKVAVLIAQKMKQVLHIEGLNILNNNHQIAGQTVFHFHLHLIPRYNKNELVFNLPIQKTTEKQVKKLQKQLKIN